MSEEVSRSSLARTLGLSQMAASRIVRELIDVGLVEEAGMSTRKSGPGRYQTLLRIREEGVYAAGIVFSAYSTEIAIVSATGRQIAHRVVRTGRYADGAKVLVKLGQALNRLIDEHSVPRERIIGVGVVLSAILDPSRQCVLDATYLGLENFDVVEPIARVTGLRVTAENIVNALTLAETSVGVAKDMQNVIVVRSATSIGATIMQHGRIVRGHGFRAGRIGHIRLRRTQLTCSCGRCDCLNCSASGWAVLVRHGTVDDDQYRPKEVTRYANAIERITDTTRRGDRRDAQLDRHIRNAGGALAEVLHMFNQTVEPEAIVLAGSMACSQEYIDGIKRRLSTLDDDGQATAAKIRIGSMRGVRAAGILVLLEQIYSPSLDLGALKAKTDLAQQAVP